MILQILKGTTLICFINISLKHLWHFLSTCRAWLVIFFDKYSVFLLKSRANLEPKPEERITLKQVKAHTWLYPHRALFRTPLSDFEAQAKESAQEPHHVPPAPSLRAMRWHCIHAVWLKTKDRGRLGKFPVELQWRKPEIERNSWNKREKLEMIGWE